MAVVVGESLYRQGPVASQYMEGENEWTQPGPIAIDAVVGSREGGGALGSGPVRRAASLKQLLSRSRTSLRHRKRRNELLLFFFLTPSTEKLQCE